LESDLPNSLAEFKSYLNVLENDLLKDAEPFLEGRTISMADIQIAWPVQATFEMVDVLKMRDLDKSSYPKTQAWIQNLPVPTPKTISADEAAKRILSSENVEKILDVNENDPLHLAKGEKVAIQMSDDLGRSGRPPQVGGLLGLSDDEVVIGLSNGIRMHFPRIGVVVRKTE
jgi:hypothetical protein